jgi:hypothetical protein
MIATMAVDLDHLLATPIFKADRPSIGYHPLHTKHAIGVYFIGLFFKPTRVISVGLLFHMLTDYQDSLWIRYSKNKFKEKTNSND